MIDVAPMRRGDLGLTADVLAASHVHDPAMAWIYQDPLRRERALRALFRLAINDVARAGRIDVARDHGRVVGAAAWLPPGAFPVPWRRQLDSAPAFARLIGIAPASLPRLMRFLAACTNNFPAQPRWQLNVVGVAPESQGRGTGRALLTSMIAQVGDDMHLETWNPANLAFYRCFGFQPEATDHPLGPAGPQRWTLTCDTPAPKETP